MIWSAPRRSRTASAVQGDFIEVVGQPRFGSGAVARLQARLRRLCDRLSLGFTSQSCKQRGQFVRLPITDIKRHHAARVDENLHDTTAARNALAWEAARDPMAVSGP